MDLTWHMVSKPVIWTLLTGIGINVWMAFVGNTTNIAEDILCKLIINESRRMSCWNVFSFQNSYFRNVQGNRTCAGYEVFQEIKNHSKTFSVECCPFFESIMQSIDTKGWVDIENAYYQFLKESATGVDSNCVVSELNKQLAFLQKKVRIFYK